MRILDCPSPKSARSTRPPAAENEPLPLLVLNSAAPSAGEGALRDRHREPAFAQVVRGVHQAAGHQVAQQLLDRALSVQIQRRHGARVDVVDEREVLARRRLLRDRAEQDTASPSRLKSPEARRSTSSSRPTMPTIGVGVIARPSVSL